MISSSRPSINKPATCGSRKCHVTSLQAWWFCAFVLACNSYLLYRAAINCHRYNHAPWTTSTIKTLPTEKEQPAYSQEPKSVDIFFGNRTNRKIQNGDLRTGSMESLEMKKSESNSTSLSNQNETLANDPKLSTLPNIQQRQKRPIQELYIYIGFIVLNIVCLPFIIVTSLLRIGNYANDGVRFGIEPTSLEAAAIRQIAKGNGFREEEGNDGWNGINNFFWSRFGDSGWSFVWKEAGPICQTIHVLSAFCLLLPKILVEGKYMQHGLISSDNIWRSDLDIIFHNYSPSSTSSSHLNNLNQETVMSTTHGHIGMTSQGDHVTKSADVFMTTLMQDTPIDLATENQLWDHLPSPEFLNLVLALVLYTIRYASVLWYANMSISLLFCTHLVFQTAYFLLTNCGVGVLYKIMIQPDWTQHSQTNDKLVFLLPPACMLLLHCLSSSVIFISSISVFHYFSCHYFKASSLLLQQLHSRSTSLIGQKYSATRCHGYTNNMAAAAFLFAAIGLRMAVDFDAVMAYNAAGRYKLVLSAVLADCIFALWWIILWLGFTIKQNWKFKINPRLPILDIVQFKNRCEVWVEGSTILSSANTELRNGGRKVNSRVNGKIFESFENNTKDQSKFEHLNRSEQKSDKFEVFNISSSKSTKPSFSQKLRNHFRTNMFKRDFGTRLRSSQQKKLIPVPREDIPFTEYSRDNCAGRCSERESQLTVFGNDITDSSAALIPHGSSLSLPNGISLWENTASPDEVNSKFSSRIDAAANRQKIFDQPGSRTPENVWRQYRRNLQDKCGQLFVGEPGRRRPISWSREFSSDYGYARNEPLKRRPLSECFDELDVGRYMRHGRYNSDEFGRNIVWNDMPYNSKLRNRDESNLRNTSRRYGSGQLEGNIRQPLYQNLTFRGANANTNISQFNGLKQELEMPVATNMENNFSFESLPTLKISGDSERESCARSEHFEDKPNELNQASSQWKCHDYVDINQYENAKRPQQSISKANHYVDVSNRSAFKPRNGFLMPPRSHHWRENLSPVPEQKSPSPEPRSVAQKYRNNNHEIEKMNSVSNMNQGPRISRSTVDISQTLDCNGISCHDNASLDLITPVRDNNCQIYADSSDLCSQV